MAAVPETLDGIARVERIRSRARPAQAVAIASARAAYTKVLDRRRAEVRNGALPEFKARMAALPENRDGLKKGPGLGGEDPDSNRPKRRRVSGM